MLDSDAKRIAQILRDSPVWARLALTAQADHLRERAAETMAALIVHQLREPEHTVEQPRLPGMA